ncbi:NAD(P)-binding domain-containing protein [Pochonia chlamydosporia 170]|uniref:NAD(P)-binding domain-containing protein n=1 Tax=Pochonia chlamydosporia 170 TaxID=1380566 RepID=A0A179G7J5_METCM|nr:NAD(P)-binding domain-containing protein [Pochonia chlamydosporia 170]OAQ73508.1 NAD(P)-binding domain-containing protein [Pochonia chlamydosporia 170]
MSTRTIAFLGATGGCGLSALKRSVAAGYTCIALCRTPSKMEALFPEKPANLILKQGNAHDAIAVGEVLLNPSNPTTMVDAVNFSIGGNVHANLTMDDPDVCKKGIAALLSALDTLRKNGVSGKPLIAVVSTTGISEHGRDVPLLFVPLYHVGLKAPHADKKVAEQNLYKSSERFVLVRPSLLQDGEKADRKIRVHVESEKGVEQKEVGYFISREDVGRWMFENLLREADKVNQYERKAVGLTW